MESLDTLLVSGADTLVLGRYRLHERLGAGGFGVVWSAYDEQLHREVAVKRIWLHPPAERAMREAQAAARLSHPAIVALYEAQAEGEAFYLISELVHGDTLGTLLAGEELCDEEALAIGVALAAALEHAHARGVIHRDVKPHNILVPHDPLERAVGVAKLTDFGGALLAGEDALTRTGDVLGTLAYMAPEQSEGREATAQTDLYSLALVLYEALSGVNPVRGANPAATARRIGGELPPLHRHRRDLPRETADALDAALAPDPRERGTLAELREALEETQERGLDRGRPRARAPRKAPIRAPTPPLPTRERALDPHHAEALGTHRPEGLDAVPSQAGLPPYQARRGAVPSQSPSYQARREAVPSQPWPYQARRGAVPSRSIPRAVWLILAAAVAIWQSVAGRPGVALLALAAAAPLLLPRRTSPKALSAALAPALGVVGLAGAHPAVAGQAPSWRARAGLGALGYWWLCLAEPLLGRRLWLGPPQGLLSHPGPRGAWEGSLGVTFDHVLAPLLATGVLLGAALWGLAALLLPWLVRGRHAALDLVAATMWTAALLAAEPLLDHGLPLSPGQPLPRGALLAAILGGALAVGSRALRGPV